MNNTPKTDVIERIQDYLLSGGIWNPELAIHDNVRDLIIDCRTQIERLHSELYNAKNAFSEILKTNQDTPVLIYQKMEDIARNALKNMKDNL